jgi:hypothetical protein
MKRLYYLTESIDSAEEISNDLHQAGITDWNFHVLSKDEAGLYKRHLHSANYLQKLDIVRNGERGAMIGFAVAILVTWYVVSAEPFGSQLNGMVYAAIFGFITLFGAWMGGLVGLSRENQKIAEYHDEIESGKFLIMVDVKAEEEDKVREAMARRHPEAQFKRVGSTFINPFKFEHSHA